MITEAIKREIERGQGYYNVGMLLTAQEYFNKAEKLYENEMIRYDI